MGTDGKMWSFAFQAASNRSHVTLSQHMLSLLQSVLNQINIVQNIMLNGLNLKQATTTKGKCRWRMSLLY